MSWLIVGCVVQYLVIIWLLWCLMEESHNEAPIELRTFICVFWPLVMVWNVTFAIGGWVFENVFCMAQMKKRGL